jgi:DNA polymerase-3 subunit alpha
VTIYQEQYMAIARRVGGCTPAQADDLRKAISKKNKKLMASLKDPLMEGLRASGLPQNVCNKLWSNFEATGDYSFNKSHAACYALISYRTAFLKANYPVEYMAAVVSSVMNTKDKVPFYVNQCHEMGIDVLPPDVNESEVGFTVVEGKIRFGLNAVKGVGVGAIESIVLARADGRFTSIYDFCARVDSALVNRRTLEALIKSGAFDSTGDTRRGMLEALPAASASGERRRRDRAQGQGGLFDVLAADSSNEMAHHPAIGDEEFDSDILLRFEKEALGLYVSSHPLEGLRAQLRDQIDATVSQLGDLRDGQTVWTGGVISGLARRQTRSGSTMAVFRLDDVDGGIEVVAFGSICEQFQDLLVEDAIVLVRGRLDRKSEDDVKLIALELRPFDGVSASRPLTLVLNADLVQMDLLDELKSILGSFPGEVPVVLQLTTEQGRHRLKVGNKYRVEPVRGLYAELKCLLGESCVRVGR